MYELNADFRKAVENRILSTLTDQTKVYDNIKKGRPFDSENDQDRKTAYIKRKVGVSTAVAKQIADYQNISNLDIPESKKVKAESLQGSTVDFMGVCFADLARAASHSVARVIFMDGKPQGTGFMISPSLFITNQHVIRDQNDAKGFMLEFNYEQDFQLKQLTQTRYMLDPEKFFLNSPETELDFSLIAIGEKVEGPLDIPDIGFLPLFDSDDKHIKALFVNCIEHPNGDYKQLVIRENRLTARTENTLIYNSDTLPGASGAPIFNDDWEVLAIHHYGEPYRAIGDEANHANDLPAIGNEGIRISSIVKFLSNTKVLPKLQFTLLQESLAFNFRHPSLILNGEKHEKSIGSIGHDKNLNIMANNDIKDSFNANRNIQNSSVSFTVPLTISVQLGSLGPSNGTIDTKIEVTPEIISVAESIPPPNTNYSDRKGYDKNFLGIIVDLPKLSTTQLSNCAKNKDDSSNEFKYQNFTIIMNGSRKLAYFTAVNIDGASVIKINRETGKISRGPESAEGREKWYDDKRILETEVCNDSLYRTSDFSIFQRGHLVKRTDPSWGTAEKAIRGQSDTFHFLNCSPQHFDFNPNKTRWAGVEDWITDTSDSENLRVSVFSGPIFENDDPIISDLKIPKSFWKIVCWIENGRLKSTGIIATQAMLLDVVPKVIAGESLEDLPSKVPVDYHCKISYLEEVTGLSFDTLKAADTFPEGEALETNLKRLSAINNKDLNHFWHEKIK